MATIPEGYEGLASKEELEEIRKAFDSYDEDKSGTMERKELNNLAADLGQEFDEEELDEAFASLDQDGSGKIEFAEFVRWWLGA
jgi:Ca2+-binding EF-hand superfamily protein